MSPRVIRELSSRCLACYSETACGSQSPVPAITADRRPDRAQRVPADTMLYVPASFRNSLDSVRPTRFIPELAPLGPAYE